MEDSVDENWLKVIGEKSSERCENERIVDPFSAKAPYEGQHFDTVEDVFPNTRHQFCLWHIANKCPEKIGHVYREPSTFKEDIDSIMQNTYEAVEFETKWMDLMKKHKLDDNAWMQGIFNIRQRWIPLWNRETFFAGMSSTGRNELDSYLQNYDDPLTQIDASQQNISTSVTDSLVSGTMILNPLVVQTKGRAKIDHKKGARWKGGMEEVVMKKKKTCKSYGVLGNHDKQTCPLLKAMIAESRDNNYWESVQPLHSNSDNHNI
ncbi:hypothetical protein GIB67_015976 [Kingdonia uniflora]|uniref:Protein FAR1-RELATED SEQUENCE n=1 Tax=Kingdonia uniflora TaxID=39325 RepID=A0A7J7PCC1_9MAGN|nr:hypothetical protein GIB67_015976 [Kingdonia uniflora]